MVFFPFSHKPSLRGVGFAALLLSASLATAVTAEAADAVSFKGETITILVGSKPGGSTDLSARLIGPTLTKHLPGHPNFIVHNMPGAHNLIALNYFTTQAKPDGLTISVASSSQTDPINYRVPQSHYDPTTFEMIGGVDLGGTSMVIRNGSLSRLTDMNARPIAMGTVSGYPHVGMLMAAWGIEYLGWNAKWVSGYSNNSDLSLALERDEIDMTSLADAWFLQNPALLDKSKFTIIYQTGSNDGTKPSEIPAIAKVPMFTKAMKGKVSDPVAKDAYEYWRHLSFVFKWAALPPKTPAPIVETYREAYRKAVADPEFIANGQKLTPGFSVISAKELTTAVKALSKVSSEATHYMTKLLNEQGLEVVATKKKKHKKTH
jgi:hypothetical protein